MRTIKEYMNKVKVYLMVGIPGSGKSTWIKNNLGDKFPIVSRDIIRVDLGYTKSVDEKFKGTPEQEKRVTEAENAKIKEYIESGKDFVIDDTNTSKYRKGMIDMLHSFGAYVIGVNMETSLETCIERRKGQIDEKIMREIYNKQIPLNKNEVDKLIVVKYE